MGWLVEIMTSVDITTERPGYCISRIESALYVMAWNCCYKKNAELRGWLPSVTDPGEVVNLNQSKNANGISSKAQIYMRRVSFSKTGEALLSSETLLMIKIATHFTGISGNLATVCAFSVPHSGMLNF
jgi:hypothetical protein